MLYPDQWKNVYNFWQAIWVPNVLPRYLHFMNASFALTGFFTFAYFSHKLKQNPNDVIYTPLPVALDMIEKCNIEDGMKVLDPCRGAGVFYDNLPNKCIKDYCEIEDGKDFFEYNEKVDLIIGNPPYSLWNKWIEKTSELTDKFCYIMNNFNMTPVRLNKIKELGFGLTYMKILRIDWWFAESYICIFEKG